MARNLAWDWIGDAHDRFAVGDQILVRVTEVNKTSQEEMSVHADVKSITENTSREALKRCRVQSKYAGRVTDVHKGIVYVRLSNGVNAVAHSCYDRRTPGKKGRCQLCGNEAGRGAQHRRGHHHPHYPSELVISACAGSHLCCPHFCDKGNCKMAVFRVERSKDYTVMSNHHLRNKELTLKAKGLLSQMLSLPEDWDYTLKGLAAINRESIDAIRTAVLELEQAGYIVRSRVRDDADACVAVITSSMTSAGEASQAYMGKSNIG